MKAFVVLLGLLTSALARDRVDGQYAKNLLQRLESDKFEYWRGMGEQPPGGYVFRFEYDVTGDGQNEAFLASSIDGDHRSANWSVFTENADGWFSTGQVLLRAGSIFSKPVVDSRCLALGGWCRTSGSNYWINQYEFKPDATFADQSREVLVVTEDDRLELGSESWGEKQGLGRKIAPNVSMMLFGEYLTNLASKWRPYNIKLPANSQHQDEQERTRVVAVSGFSPEQAARLIASFDDSLSVKSDEVPREWAPVAITLSPKLSADEGKREPLIREQSSPSWLMAGAMIAVAIGILWLARKLWRR